MPKSGSRLKSELNEVPISLVDWNIHEDPSLDEFFPLSFCRSIDVRGFEDSFIVELDENCQCF